jgi:hypothetical protein
VQDHPADLRRLREREFTAVQTDDLYELLTERVGRPGRSLILTSNRSPADWYPLFPNAVVGESILDRVLNTGHRLLLDGKSYWPRRRPASTSQPPPDRARHDQEGDDQAGGRRLRDGSRLPVRDLWPGTAER